MMTQVSIKYEEPYLPPRCRKMRYMEFSETVQVNLPEVSADNLKLAFEDQSYDGKGKIYSYNNALWTKAKVKDICMDEGQYKTALDALLDRNIRGSKFFLSSFDRTHYDKDTSREAAMQKVYKYMDDFLVTTDGELYIQTNEPRYVVVTFGLGHNHGGTALLVGYHYGFNIESNNYFNANESDKAIAYAKEVAKRRGDTDSIRLIKKNIEVFMPDMVKLNPQKNHPSGGNETLKMMEQIVESSDSTLEAGIMCIALSLV